VSDLFDRIPVCLPTDANINLLVGAEVTLVGAESGKHPSHYSHGGAGLLRRFCSNLSSDAL
jgi:hypothetical protein